MVKTDQLTLQRALLLKVGFWILCLFLGILQALANRFKLSSEDAVSYLDIGDAYFKEAWHLAINAYWSPLYSWLLGFVLAFSNPNSHWEFFVVKWVNLLLLVLALIGFEYFLQQLLAYQNYIKQSLPIQLFDNLYEIPEWIWIVSGYSLFLLASIGWIGIDLDAPDMATAAFVYLAAGLLLRLQMQPDWRTSLGFGFVLGLGYLSKSVMFPLALIFLATSIGLDETLWKNKANRRSAFFRTLLALLAFTIIVMPFVANISLSKGKLTFGETGKINYVWYINKSVREDKHWQGKEANTGTPVHPTRQIFSKPPVFEFATPILSTSPTWYDPSYWYEGLDVHFNLKQQIKVAIANLRYYYGLLSVPIFSYILLVYVGGNLQTSFRQLLRYKCLLIPAIAALSIYLVAMDLGSSFRSERYVAPFIVLLVAAVFSSVRLFQSLEAKRMLLGLLMISLMIGSANYLKQANQDIKVAVKAQPTYWQIAVDLERMGLKPNDPIAVLGDADDNAYWARLAHLRIIAQVPESKRFWQSDKTVQTKILAAMARTGAKAVVQEVGAEIPVKAIGWQKLGNVNCYAHLL